MAAGALLLAGLTPLAPAIAADDPVGAAVNLQYPCNTSRGDNGIKFPTTLDTNAPTQMFVGDAPASITLTPKVTIPSSMISSYWWLGTRKVKGPISFLTQIGATTTEPSITLDRPGTFGASSNWELSGSGSLGSFTPSTPGDVDIRVTRYSGTLTFVDNAAGWISYNDAISCTVPAGAVPVDTIRVISRSHTEVTAPIADAQQGSPATATAHVSVDGGTVAGKVKFMVGAASVEVPVGASGTVTANLPVVGPGNHSVTAEFIPTNAVHYRGSTSDPVPFKVKASQQTATTLSAPTTALSTAQVQLRSTVASIEVGSSDVPVGDVEFLIDNTVVATVPVASDGTATALVSSLAVGPRNATARFVPANSNVFGPSTSPVRTITVSAPASPTTTTLAVQPSTVSPSQRATLHAQVFADSGNPTGSVFFDVSGPDGYFETFEAQVANKEASYELPQLPEGEYDVLARYSPSSPAFQPSASANAALTVAIVPATGTTATLSLSPSSVLVGGAVDATVTVTANTGSAHPVGTVTVTVNGQQVTGRVQNGVATVSLPAVNTAGTYPVTASFAPDDATVFTASTATARTLTVTVPPAVDTTLGLTLSRSSVTEGDAVIANAVVTPAAAAGSVEFTVDGQTYAVAAVNGSAELNLPDLAPGSYNVQARFVPADTAAHNASPVQSQTLTVQARPASDTSTTLSLSRSQATTAQTVTATAVVSSDYGRPGGTVTFAAGTLSITSPVAGGVATATLAGLPAGTHTVTASFTPNNPAKHTGSIATPQTLVVTAAPAEATVTTATLLNNPVVAGRDVDVRVEVASTDGAAAGDVQVTLNGETRTATLAGGVASLKLAGVTTVGQYPVTVQFLPANGSNLRASSDTRTLTVVAPPASLASTTVIDVEDANVTVGRPVRVNAAVAVPGVTVAGQVTFTAKQGSTTRTETVALANGEAAAEFTGLGVGVWTLNAAFAPSGSGIAASASADASVTVAAKVAEATVTELELSESEAARTDEVTATATVRSGSGTPVGKVSFAVGGTTVEATVVGGVAHATLPALAAGDNSVVATFVPADATDHAGSSSTARTVSVHDVSSVVLSLSSGVTPADAPATATATVTSSAGTATGSVTFAVGGATVSAVLANGVATAKLPVLAAGDHTVLATYAPLASTTRGSSANLAYKVTAAAPAGPSAPAAKATEVKVSASAAASVYGQKVQVVAQVSAGAEGVVTFSTGGSAIDVPVSSGQAAVTLPNLPVGTHTVRATFLPADAAARLSGSAETTVTVGKDTVKLRFAKRWTPATRILNGKVRVAPKYKSLATGSVTLVLEKKVGKKYKKVATTKASLNANGFIEYSFRLKGAANGTYRARVAYSGSDALLPAKIAKPFRIG